MDIMHTPPPVINIMIQEIRKYFKCNNNKVMLTHLQMHCIHTQTTI